MTDEQTREQKVRDIYNGYDKSRSPDKVIEEYHRVIGGDYIPMMMLMGNEFFYNEFNYDMIALYIYCIQHKKKWEDVLKFKYDNTVLY